MASYNRILLKLSGESLMGEQQYGIDPARLQDYAEDIKVVIQAGIEVAVVIGGGNIFRGMSGTGKGFDRVTGDQMGMLATVINSLALQSALQTNRIKSRVFTSIRMEPVGEYYTRDKAVDALKNGEVAIIAGGTGNPFFTTDTASALRGVEIGADVLFKGTRVDGIYSADPEKDPLAVRFDTITFDEVYQRGLKIMDLTALTLCRENNLKIVVFNMDQKGNLIKVIQNEKIGTLVYGG
jgi:uridylate kinase